MPRAGTPTATRRGPTAGWWATSRTSRSRTSTRRGIAGSFDTASGAAENRQTGTEPGTRTLRGESKMPYGKTVAAFVVLVVVGLTLASGGGADPRSSGRQGSEKRPQ